MNKEEKRVSDKSYSFLRIISKTCLQNKKSTYNVKKKMFRLHVAMHISVTFVEIESFRGAPYVKHTFLNI